MPKQKEVAVVIGFRDWGLNRLAAAVQSHASSKVASNLDIVVSDYGSLDSKSVREVVEANGGRVVRSPRIGPWSRSRALNAGVLGTETKYCVTTDADMLFSDECISKLLSYMKYDKHTAHLVQCRDLKEGFTADLVADLKDKELEKNSSFRPRWGMGGLVAFSRDMFDAIDGYDNRMEVYGGEDIDFANRLRRSGVRLNWVDSEDIRIYHIWHPSTMEEVRNDPEQLAAQLVNREIMLEDKSFVRNVIDAPNIIGRAKPLASVAIATYNRSEFVSEAVYSALSQTAQDIEVVVVDDGSTDETLDVLNEIDDKRLRVFSQDNAGVASARNHLLEKCNSDYIVVHDDDDIMLPDRVENHFAALVENAVGPYGGWIDFDQDTGELTLNQGREYIPNGFMYTGKVLVHGASMFRTDVLKQFGYDESLKAGVDYHLIARLAHAGHKMVHTRNVHILRRFHSSNLTVTNAHNQQRSSHQITNVLRKNIAPSVEREYRKLGKGAKTVNCVGAEDITNNFAVYLPDHLVERSAFLSSVQSSDLETLKSADIKYNQVGGVLHSDKNSEALPVELLNVTYPMLPKLRRAFGGRIKYEYARNLSDIEPQDIPGVISQCVLPLVSLSDDLAYIVLYASAADWTGTSSHVNHSLIFERKINNEPILIKVLETDFDQAAQILSTELRENTKLQGLILTLPRIRMEPV